MKNVKIMHLVLLLALSLTSLSASTEALPYWGHFKLTELTQNFTIEQYRGVWRDGSSVNLQLMSNGEWMKTLDIYDPNLLTMTTIISNDRDKFMTIVSYTQLSHAPWAPAAGCEDILAGELSPGDKATEEKILGFPALHYRNVMGAGDEQYVTERWISPALGCAVIKEIAYYPDGKAGRLLEPLSLTADEPDVALRVIPSDVTDLPPSRYFSVGDRPRPSARLIVNLDAKWDRIHPDGKKLHSEYHVALEGGAVLQHGQQAPQ